MTKPVLAPSLLSADFSKLAEEIRAVEEAGVSWLHVDVMDGHFVPNLTLGPVVVQGIRPHTNLKLDCHLMVTDPKKWIEPFAKAGADCITIHAEAQEGTLPEQFAKIRALGCLAGVSINPSTDISVVDPLLDQIDLVLVMSVNPGFAGQGFIEAVLPKVAALKKARGHRKFLIEVDGGIQASNIGRVVQAGADVIVAGSAVFGAKDRRAAIDLLIDAMSKRG